jgi:hypothetical protein
MGGKMSKAVVCGGGDFQDVHLLHGTLNVLISEHSITCIVHGGAEGADSLAELWARDWGIERITYRADQRKHGRAAVAIRNQNMLDAEEPDLVVAFPGEGSTEDMVRRARAAGVLVIEVGK